MKKASCEQLAKVARSASIERPLNLIEKHLNHADSGRILARRLPIRT